MLVVNPALPVKSVTDLVAYAKANPGKMSFASVGPGVPHHLYMEMFKSMTGIEASHVPYRGSLPALERRGGGSRADDVRRSRSRDRRAAGRHGASARHVDRGSAFPASPTFRRSPKPGVPGFEAVGWQMLVAPAQDAAADLDRLNREMTGMLAQPDTKEQISQVRIPAGRQQRR